MTILSLIGGVYGLWREHIPDTYRRILQNGWQYPRCYDGCCFRRQNKWTNRGHSENKLTRWIKRGQGWESTEVADSLNVYDNSEMRTPILIVEIKNERTNRH